jgi:hypothetical protein
MKRYKLPLCSNGNFYTLTVFTNGDLAIDTVKHRLRPHRIMIEGERDVIVVSRLTGRDFSGAAWYWPIHGDSDLSLSMIKYGAK